MNHEQEQPEQLSFSDGDIVDLGTAREERSSQLDSVVIPLGGAAIVQFPDKSNPHADIGYSMNNPHSAEVLRDVERQQYAEDVEDQVAIISELAGTPRAKLYCRGLMVLRELADEDYIGDISGFTTQQYGRNAGNGNRQDRQYRALRDGMALETVIQAITVDGVHKNKAEHPWRVDGFIKNNLKVNTDEHASPEKLRQAVYDGLIAARNLLGTFGVDRKGEYVMALRMAAFEGSGLKRDGKKGPTDGERKRALAKFLLEDTSYQDTIPPDVA